MRMCFHIFTFVLFSAIEHVTVAPLALLLSVTCVDKRLGFLQKSFYLTGNGKSVLTDRNKSDGKARL